MGILGRLSTLVKSNVNDLIDSMQDPAKEIDQMIRDMEDSARQARTEVAQTMAEEKRLAKKVEQLAGEVTTWEEHAMRAVKAGDDALAREALKRKAEKEADRLETEKALNEQKAYVDQLTAGLKALEARVKEVKLRQGSLREKARASKGKSPTSTKTSAFDDFERMSGKIEAVEAEAGLAEELSGDTAERREADRKLRALTEDKSVDDALADLKKKLGDT
jgi:phage shock protein A